MANDRHTDGARATDTTGTPDLAGRVAIVTGASREIGAAMATALARRGAAVLVAHHEEPALADATVEAIARAGGRALAHDCDCSLVDANTAMIARAVEAFGRLDLFVANAGLTSWGAFLDYTEEAWDTVANLNLKGSFFGAQAAARQMIAQRAPGTIVFSSSIAGVQAIPFLSAYGATKAGLRHMARCLALELGPHRITVNAIGIGPTLNARNLADDPAYDEHWGALLPAGRAARPDDIADALLYLARSTYVTGEILMVDGGWTIHSPTPTLDFATKR